MTILAIYALKPISNTYRFRCKCFFISFGPFVVYAYAKYHRQKKSLSIYRGKRMKWKSITKFPSYFNACCMRGYAPFPYRKIQSNLCRLRIPHDTWKVYTFNQVEICSHTERKATSWTAFISCWRIELLFMTWVKVILLWSEFDLMVVCERSESKQKGQPWSPPVQIENCVY